MSDGITETSVVVVFVDAAEGNIVDDVDGEIANVVDGDMADNVDGDVAAVVDGDMADNANCDVEIADISSSFLEGQIVSFDAVIGEDLSIVLIEIEVSTFFFLKDDEWKSE